MAEQFKMDITGWQMKVKNVKAVQARICKDVVDWGLKQLFEKTNDNVKGPYYGYKDDKITPKRGSLTNAGKFPIPVVTGQLRRSIKQIRFNTVFGAVYSDPAIAPYNKWVHDGTRYMKKRPFLQNAVDSRRPAILNYMKYQILKEVRKAGRA